MIDQLLQLLIEQREKARSEVVADVFLRPHILVVHGELARLHSMHAHLILQLDWIVQLLLTLCECAVVVVAVTVVVVVVVRCALLFRVFGLALLGTGL